MAKIKVHNFIFVVILLIAMSACQQNRVAFKELLSERDSLLLVNQNQKQELDELNSFVTTISDGLDSISYQENILKIGNVEGTPLTRSEIRTRLSDLSDLLARQKEKISILQDSIKYLKNASQLNTLVSYLNEQLTVKEAEINRLKSELKRNKSDIANLQKQISSLNENVDNLDKINQIQHDVMESQDKILNEGYVFIGSKKQLKQEGILKGNKLNPAALTPDKFQIVDIREYTEVQFKSRRPKVLTTMPQDSYVFNSNGDGTSTLVINDPASFWSSSSYLVIVTE